MALPDHPMFKQPEDPSIRAWRYLDTAKLVSLLLSNELRLTRLDQLPDKFEGTYTRRAIDAVERDAIADQLAAGATPEESEKLAKSLLRVPGFVRRVMYVSCWHLGDHESEAMWRLYCGTKEGVAIVLPYRQLKESLTYESTFIGRVEYIDYEADSNQSDNLLSLAMHKRREFRYESEARIVHLDPGPISDRPPSTLSAVIPWTPAEHITSLIVSPYAERWYIDMVRDLVSRIAPNLRDKVIASSMGARPTYEDHP